MTPYLTPYDSHGQRWTTDRTIKVISRYRLPGMRPDRRNKPIGYTVHDILNQSSTEVSSLRGALSTATSILAARPKLLWGGWHRSPGNSTFRTCTADSPRGVVQAWMPLREDPGHPGMWRVSLTIGTRSFQWMSDIRGLHSRMLNVRAVAEHNVFKMGAQ